MALTPSSMAGERPNLVKGIAWITRAAQRKLRWQFSPRRRLEERPMNARRKQLHHWAAEILAFRFRQRLRDAAQWMRRLPPGLPRLVRPAQQQVVPWLAPMPHRNLGHLPQL